jgi:hypothetical protein
MDDIIKIICARHKLEIIKIFNLGDTASLVFQVKCNDKLMVLKVALDTMSKKQVKDNYIGYKRMIQMGLSELVPTIYAFSYLPECAYILMDYCGENFIEIAKKASDPLVLYKRLATNLHKIYLTSLCQRSQEQNYINEIFNNIVMNYQKYLRESLDPPGRFDNLIHEVCSSSSFGQDLRLACFADWNFTPENVYLTETSFKYSDPNKDVIGIPIIDLACFAGVARDAYELPGSHAGYQILVELALKSVPEILQIPNDTAVNIFNASRVLQLFLSARFRIKNNFKKAEILFHKGINYLKQINISYLKQINEEI